MNIRLVLVLLFLGLNAYSQDRGKKENLFEMQKVKVIIDIDKNVFTNVYANMYVSKKPNALVVALFLPISYNQQKLKLDALFVSKKMKIKGEKMIRGKKVLFMKGTINKEGIDFIKEVYYLKYNKKTSIELTIMLDINADAKYKKMINEIVYSVIEKN